MKTKIKKQIWTKAQLEVFKINGKRGGIAKFKNMTHEQRVALGKKAAEARWGKK